EVLASLGGQGRGPKELLPADRELEPARLDHSAPAASRLQELKSERAAALVRRLDASRLDPLDLLQPRLRLPRLRRLVAEPLDEALEPRDLLRLSLGRPGLVGRAGRLLAPPHVPRAGEVRRPPVLELQHRGRHRLEEPAVV